MISIRKFREADILPMHEAIVKSTAALIPWLTWCHENYTIEEVKLYIEVQEILWRTGQQYNFAIVDAQTDIFLGSVGLNQVNQQYKKANLGYWVRTDITGKGIASEATRQAARFGIKQIGLRRIEIVAAATNIGSCRAAEKAGAKKEGLLRNRVLVNLQLQDGFIYSIIPEDLEV